MLRLTRVAHGTDGVTLFVEGAVVSQWGEFLANECAAAQGAGQRVYLDLAGVTYVDAQSAQVLRRLVPAQVGVLRCAPLIEEILREGELA